MTTDEFVLKKKKQNRFLLRMITTLLISPVLLLGLVVYKSHQIQIVQGDWYQNQAKAQQLTRPTISARRGDIVDRNGSSLALTMDLDSIFVRPRQVTDVPQTAKALAAALDMPESRVLIRLKSKSPFVWLRRHAPPEVSAAVREQKLPGVGFEKEPARFYPYQELAGQVLGFVNIDSKGLEGMEHYFDRQLTGQTQQVVLLRDARGRRLFAAGDLPPDRMEGDRLVLTLDRTIQHVAEVELAKAVKEHGAKGGKVVVMDVHSGDILAIAHYPFFNPDGTNRSGPMTRNRAVTDIFEPGSILKTFTIAGALEDKLISLDTVFNCEWGRYRIGGHTVRDYIPRDKLTTEEILTVSNNIGTIKIAQLMGKESLHDWMKRFGFGTRSGIQFPGEVPGILHPASRWADITLANVSFGQGIATTAVQLTAAMGAVANGGVLMQPRLVAEIRNERDEVVERFAPKKVHRALSPGAAAQTTQALVAAVHGHRATGRRAAINGYKVAGKTGTAQQVDPVAGGYADVYVSSFLGFAPADNPHIVALVSIEDANPVRFGGVVAAPAFSSIVEFALKHMEVFPQDGDDNVAKAILPADGPTQTQREIITQPIVPVASSKEKESIENLKEGLALNAPSEVEAKLKSVPDFGGHTLRSVLVLASQAGLTVKPTGSGLATFQDPAPGTPLDELTENEIKVRFVPVHVAAGTTETFSDLVFSRGGRSN